MGEKKARHALKDLVAANLARQFKDGRTLRYWATARGSRPDLGLEDEVLCIARGLPEAEVRRIALERRRCKLLGLLGDEENLATVQLVYRSVYKLDFEEKIERSVLRRLVGPKYDQRIGSVYVHPHTLGIVVFTPQEGVVFADQPAERASEVEDFDGQVVFEGARPMDLPIDEHDWAGRKSVKDVTSHFGTRFAASPGTVTPLFVPLWHVTYVSRGGAGYRREMVDGIVGNPPA